MHVFTSITANYLPKASALAHSVKRVHPDAKFHVVLSDTMPECPSAITSAFDSIISIDQLPVDRSPSWIFKHRLVELCTAVKGAAFEYIAEKHNADVIFYFDPDMIVANPLDDLLRTLDKHTILLTPHQTVPDTDFQAILDNEVCCLKNGVYNLGFLAVRMTGQGRDFITWWAERLRHLCYDEVANGLFTDQRWVDLAPALFDDIAILRDPQYNVATWNLTHRRATGTAPYDIAINGRPLGFYHFSGFDSGAQKIMLERYGAHSPVLFEFRDWYIARCEELGQSTLGKINCIYNSFSNGEPITSAHRWTYRRRGDLMNAFPNPFDASDPESSYFQWFLDNGVEQPSTIPKVEPPLLKKLMLEYGPPPALKLARTARSAYRRWSMSA